MITFAPSLKLLAHADKVAEFLSGDWTAAPVQVEISPTNDCNAKCPWCFYVDSDYKQHHSKEELEWNLLEGALNDFKGMGVKAITWTGGGDPSVYSCIDKGIALAAHLKLKQGMFTNAYKVINQPNLLDWIRITVTEKYVITKHVAEYAKQTKVGVNFNYCAENEIHLGVMIKEARDAGVAYFQIRPALADRYDLQKQVDFPTWIKDGIPGIKIETTDYKWQDYLRPHGYKTCYGHHFVPFLWHNGDVSVCAYHFGKPEYTFGNLHERRFLDIWKGVRRMKMTKEGIDVIPDCQHCCKLHEINKPLAKLMDDEIDDEDFL